MNPTTINPSRRLDAVFARVCLSVCALLMVAGCRGPSDHPQIRAVLAAQVKAWNAADIEGFMSHYWKSDRLTFVSTLKVIDPATGKTRIVSTTAHGWQATLDRYKQRYPSPEAMGKLTFSDLKIAKTAEDAADLSGRYHLSPKDGGLTGRFFLNLRRINGRWVITRDHTVAD